MVFHQPGSAGYSSGRSFWASQLIFLLLLLKCCEPSPILNYSDESTAGIYLSINARAFTLNTGEVVKRRLEISWYGRQVEEADLIILEKDGSPILEVRPSQHSDGFLTTDIMMPYPDMLEMGFTSTCLFNYSVFWLDSQRGEVATNCLRTFPTWMEDHKEDLAEVEVGMLMLAGAHDAGAYRDYQGPGDDNLATSAVFAQEEDLFHQLLWGVRFQDIRIGYYPTLDEKFWLVHGIIKTYPLEEGLQQVVEFLRNTRETVVWEINSFEQVWDEEAHQLLQQLLKDSFTGWLVKPGSSGWKTSLGEVNLSEGTVEGEGRIIITYNDGHADPALFFPSVKGRWGDVDEPEDLRAYLKAEVGKAENNPEYQPWKPNCQLTPTAEDIVGGRWSGLREMADAVNRNVTAWWREDWPQLPATFPISDFIISTDMISESIRRNLRLAASQRERNL